VKTHTDLASFHGVERPVLTTGTFDGVHRGHRAILRRLLEEAREEGGESVLFTFHPHPRMVLFPADDDLRLLSTREEKVALLEECGLDHLLEVPFSMRFSRMRADEYVRDVLVDAIGACAVVIGHDHRFGRNREGDLPLLRSLGGTHGFRVVEVGAQRLGRVEVSSTKVRHALFQGEVGHANGMLGYRYPLAGTVVKGDQLGRTLGYPTANIGAIDPAKLLPADGVYVVTVTLKGGPEKGGEHEGMLYIGQRPTLTGPRRRTVEVHIFGLDRDLYDEPISVRFVDRIRGDLRFDGMDGLREQLHRDRDAALRRLAIEA